MATADNSTPVKITMHNVIPYMETLRNYVDGIIIDRLLFLCVPCNFTLLKDRKLNTLQIIAELKEGHSRLCLHGYCMMIIATDTDDQ